MAQSGGALSRRTKWKLAQKAFATTAAYDSAIASTLESSVRRRQFRGPPITSRKICASSFRKIIDLALRRKSSPESRDVFRRIRLGVANAQQIQGKELSYNNIVDLQAAWDLAQEFDEPVCAIIKHTNPCGTATGEDIG